MSQDIHTPRVIASHFLAKSVCGHILQPSARRWPETLPMMDEVDGRPGPVALQFGHLDALKRVPTASLSLPIPTPDKTTKFIYGKFGPTAGGELQGEAL
jgi:hypothetical protein